jgi:hypothetical protein
MKILSHIIKLRVSLLFGNAGLSTLTKIIYGILLLISIVYGFCLSLLFEYLVDQNLLKVSKALLTFNILNAFYIFLNGFFPKYTPFYDLFLKGHPLNLFEKVLGLLIYNLFSISILLPLFFCLSFYLFSNKYSLIEFLSSIFLILSSYIILNQYKLSIFIGSFRSIFVTTFSSVLFFIVYNKFLNYSLLITCSFFFASIFSFICIYKIYLSKEYPVNRNTEKKIKDQKKPWENITSRKTLYNTIIIATVFKLIIALVIFISIINNHKNLANENVLISLICSPVTLFNYAFNNLFGYKPQIFFQLGYNSSYQNWLKYYLNNITLIVIFDFIISSILISYIDFSFDSYFYLLNVYITSILIGFLSSIFFPKKVLSVISFTNFKSNTSTLVSFFLIVFVIISFEIHKETFYFLFLSFFIYLTITLLLLKKVKNNSTSIYIKIINEII